MDTCLPSNDTAKVTKPNLHSSGDAGLVVASNVVAHPDQGNRLSDIGTTDDCEEGEVSHADLHAMHVEQDYIADAGDQASCNDEAKSVLYLVTEESDSKRTDSCKDEDWDRHDLGPDGGPAQLPQNGWCEERSAVAGRHNA